MNSWEQPSVFHKDNFRIVVVVERKSRKGEGRREEAQTEAEKVYTYIYSRWYHVFIGPRLVHGPWTVVRFYDRFSCTAAAWLTQSGRERGDTRLAYEFPLKRFRYRFRGSTSMSRSLLPLPPRLSREKENCGWNLLKGKRKKKSWGAWCSDVHVVVARFVRNDNAWMALIRRIENRVWL